MTHFRGKQVTVTGGASFIGSHLVDALVAQGALVTVIDDFSSGNYLNLSKSRSEIRIIAADVGTDSHLEGAFKDVDTVFHLAAIHGGRGFIERFPGKMMKNLRIDNCVFEAAIASGVQKIVHASSACSYPLQYQSDDLARGLLAENMANFDDPRGSFPDGAYGWVKLMGEYQLKTLCEVKESSTVGRSARIFTAYGSRENESHAVIALIAKSLLRIDPFPVWGNGKQTRNFTHVSDTVRGLLALGADVNPANYLAVNIGSSTHHTVLELLDTIWSEIGWRPENLEFQLDKPTGVRSRAADNSRILELSGGWEPRVSLRDGVNETLEWYSREIFPTMNRDTLEAKLLSR